MKKKMLALRNDTVYGANSKYLDEKYKNSDLNKEYI